MTRNVAELVERKIVNKDGSQASDGEFNRCCSFSICPAECWLTKPANAVFRNSDFFAQVKNEDQPGCGYETNSQRCPTWFQSPGQLMDLYFFDASVVLISERPYSCQSCSGIHQVQRKDWRRDQEHWLCWEIKNHSSTCETKVRLLKRRQRWLENWKPCPTSATSSQGGMQLFGFLETLSCGRQWCSDDRRFLCRCCRNAPADHRAIGEAAVGRRQPNHSVTVREWLKYYDINNNMTTLLKKSSISSFINLW